MNKFLSGAVTAALLSASAFAQMNTKAVYVGPNASPVPGTLGASASNPFPTLKDGIDEAIDHLNVLPPDKVDEVVINVMPGTYTTNADLPARGIRIAAYQGVTSATDPPPPMPRVEADLVFTTAGDLDRRPSTVEGLKITGTVELRTGGMVQIRGCSFTFENYQAFGVWVTRPTDTHSLHVIEHCHFEDISGGKNDYRGIYNAGDSGEPGTSSLLIRANTFVNLETAIHAIGDSANEVANISPRIVSNAMSLHERPIQIEYAKPWVVNNSIHAFKNHATLPINDDAVYGVGFFQCPTVDCWNNIIWFAPPAESNDQGDIYEGIPGASHPNWPTNYLEDAVGTTNPYSTFPHIAASSPLATAGDTSKVLPAANGGPSPISDNNGGTVPVDLSIDFEGDMRITRVDALATTATVAIGCDQVADIRLAVLTGGGVDSFGNWLAWQISSDDMVTQSFQVQITGLRPGDASGDGAVALLGTTLAMPQPSVPNPIDLHNFHPLLGSNTALYLFPMGGDNLLKPTFPKSQSVGTGQTVATFTAPGLLVPVEYLGERLFLQAVSYGPGATTGVVSNRISVRVMK